MCGATQTLCLQFAGKKEGKSNYKKSGTELIDNDWRPGGKILKPTTSHTSRTHTHTLFTSRLEMFQTCIADASGAGRLSEYMFKKED